MERPKYIYIDFENVGMAGLQGAYSLSAEDKIFVFDSDKRKFDNVDTRASVERISCVNGLKNKVDFIMIGHFIMDYCHNTGCYNDINFYFISKDTIFRRLLTESLFKNYFIDKNNILPNNIFILDSLQNIFLNDNKINGNISFIGTKNPPNLALQIVFLQMMFFANNIVIPENEVYKIVKEINNSNNIELFKYWFRDYLMNNSNYCKDVKSILDKSVLFYNVKTVTLQQCNNYLDEIDKSSKL